MKLETIIKTEEGRKMALKALEKSTLNPKRPLKFWEYKLHKQMIRYMRRKRDDVHPHIPCKRCGEQTLRGMDIPLCKKCYEQSERDYLIDGNLTRLEGDQSVLADE